METEFLYWQKNHVVMINGVRGSHKYSYDMIRFNCEDDGPRPESYVEDYELACENTDTDTEERTNLYWELKTGAETGWDYSSRWFVQSDDGNNQSGGNLKDTKPRSIIPVDLNSLYCLNARILSKYFRDLIQVNVCSLTGLSGTLPLWLLGTRALGHSGSWVLGLLGTRALALSGSCALWSHGLMSYWAHGLIAHGLLVTQVLGLLGTQALGLSGSWALGLLGSWSLGHLGSWALGLLGSRSLGLKVTWGHAMTPSDRHGLSVSWAVGVSG
jgi:hypothetical protein